MTPYEKLIWKRDLCLNAALNCRHDGNAYMITVWQNHARDLDKKAKALTIEAAS